MEYYGCSDIAQFSLVFDKLTQENSTAVGFCCELNPPGVPLRKTAKETLDEFIGMRNRFFLRGGVGFDENSRCAKCPHYVKKDWKYSLQISAVILGMKPTSCQCKCFYCTHHEGISNGWEKDAFAVSAYEKALDLLKLAEKENVISPHAFWSVGSGEITVHPFRKQILELVKGKYVQFNTNGFIFDEDIAKELHDNPRAFLTISLDSGTAETWHKVKGVNNFSHVIANLKRYSNAAHHPQQIQLKYIILPDINDSDEDFLSFAKVEKFLSINLVTVSSDVMPRNKAPIGYINPKLMESAARFVAIQAGLGGKVTFVHYTDEEKQLIIDLARKILSSV